MMILVVEGDRSLVSEEYANVRVFTLIAISCGRGYTLDFLEGGRSIF